MNNFIQHFKDRLWAYRLRRLLRAALAPDAEFLRKARNRFMAQAAARAGRTAAVYRGGSRVARYAAAIFVALLFANGIAVVYAERTPLSPHSALYGYKRAGESIRMGLASPKDKPLLHSAYAKRRADELKTISTSTDPSTAAKLDQDIHREIRAAFEDAESAAPSAPGSAGGNVSSSTETAETNIPGNVSENAAAPTGPIFSGSPSSTVSVTEGEDAKAGAKEDSRTILCERLSETIRERNVVLGEGDRPAGGAGGNFRRFQKLCGEGTQGAESGGD